MDSVPSIDEVLVDEAVIDLVGETFVVVVFVLRWHSAFCKFDV